MANMYLEDQCSGFRFGQSGELRVRAVSRVPFKAGVAGFVVTLSDRSQHWIPTAGESISVISAVGIIPQALWEREGPQDLRQRVVALTPGEDARCRASAAAMVG